MPASCFAPPLALRNAHLQTVAPNLISRRLPPLSGERVLFTAADGAPLLARIDWQPGPRHASPTAVLIHGLEGHAESSYMRGTASKLLRAGWHVVRLNQRGCGESETLTPTLHHGARSDDLAAVLTTLRAREGVGVLAALGFSLGGSLVLRLLGQHGGQHGGQPGGFPGLVAAAALSPLLNPALVQRHLDRPGSLVYRRFFLRTMAARMRRRASLFPSHYPQIDARETCTAATVLEFDDRYTAPYIGYASARAYYASADALPLLPAITTPTLLLHAQDDPVVPFAGLRGAPLGEHVVGEFPRHGGHLGFYHPTPGSDGYWAEDRAIAFLNLHAAHAIPHTPTTLAA